MLACDWCIGASAAENSQSQTSRQVRPDHVSQKIITIRIVVLSYLHLTTAAEKKMVAWEAGTEDQNCCSSRRTQGNEKLQKIF